MMRILKGVFFIMSVAVILALSLQIIDIPAAQAAIISKEMEIEIGRGVAQQAEQKYGLVDDPALQARIAEIGAKLAAVSDRADMPYTFKVLNGKEINAFAVPGGPIYLFKGLVDAMPSDDELAGIIGHEVGHIVKRHTAINIERSMAGQLLFSLLFGKKAEALQNIAFSLIMAGYSRAEEDDADKLGVVHTMRAGYNPYSMLLGLAKLQDLSPSSGGSMGDIFSDHPNTGARINNVKNQIANEFSVRPGVADKGKAYQVNDGSWSLPPVVDTYNGYKPMLRSYFTAGKIFRISQLTDYSASRFYLSEVGGATIIYYKDEYETVAVITANDAASNGISVNEMAAQTLNKIREWINR